ncbi:MAG: cobalt transporter CbiM [Lachnospiraceae bacterium]|jgi:cobalt/nickel transport system permease protein|nr:cobalt transporter CbiM [Lachnospiraceae bacterium]
MHIPENYLSPQTCGVMAAAMIPVWGVCIRKVKTELPKEKIALMGVGAAFSFISMMFNIPIPGGTTGHAVGGTLIAALLGPYAACLSVSVALLLQALIFGDGGVLAFGANCFNMAFALPFVGYAVYSLLRKWIRRGSGDLIGAGVGAYLGINAAALCAAIEFGVQPMLFRDSAGNALYCPYGLNLSVPAMMIGHLTVFGLAEVVFTVAVLAFVKKTSPDMIMGVVRRGSGASGRMGSRTAGTEAGSMGSRTAGTEAGSTGSRTAGMETASAASGRKSGRAVSFLLGALILATPLGLLAEGTAWGEWGVDEIAATGAGYTPAGMLKGFSLKALVPDYSFAGLPEWFGYILSAVIGAAVLIIVFRLIGDAKKPQKQQVQA